MSKFGVTVVRGVSKSIDYEYILQFQYGGFLQDGRHKISKSAYITYIRSVSCPILA